MQRDRKLKNFDDQTNALLPTKLRLTTRLLRHGSVIAYPTEAVYGLGCDPLNERAIQTILDLKQRPVEKGMILLASSYQQIEDYIEVDNLIKERITQTWPGPFTWIIPAKPWVPKNLTGHRNTLAVRVTNHPIAAKICEYFGGAIVSTSANPTGLKPPRTLLQLRKYFARQKLFIIPGKTGPLSQPTTIQDAITGRKIR